MSSSEKKSSETLDNLSTSSKVTKLRDKYREKVKGIFRFHECPGGEMTFCFKEFKGDNVEKYTFKDGETYEIPLGVAKHLNKNVAYPQHAYLLDTNGNPVVDVGKMVRRASFQSLEFLEEAI